MGQGVGFIIGVRRVGFRGYGFYSTARVRNDNARQCLSSPAVKKTASYE